MSSAFIPRRTAAAAACAGLAATLAVGFAPSATAADVATEHLVAHYLLDETSGTVAADSSGNDRDGTYIGGPTLGGDAGVRLDGTDDYVDLPDNFLTGLGAVTVTMDVLIDPSQASPYFLYALGNPATSSAGNGYLFSTGNNYRGTVSLTHWGGEQNTAPSPAAPLPRGTWQSIAYTLDGATNTATLYLNGAQVAQNTGVTVDPSAIGGGVTTANFIGKSSYAADKLLKGGARDFRLYDTALTATEVAAIAPDDATRIARDAAALSLGDTSAVTANLTLPTTAANGSTLTWSSSDPGIVAANGAVTRPLPGEGDATVTLTATLARGTEADTKDFTVTVLESDSPDAIAQADLNGIVIPNADDVRGNITLAVAGERSGEAIAWEASPAGIVSTEAADGKAAGVVTRPATDTTVTLTATIPGTTATRDLEVTVKAAPVDLDTDYTAGYLWSHFAAQGGYEKIFFGYSEDGLTWEKLNDNAPILENLAGDLGVRDPHLQRSAEGDKYWLIGTDLHAEGGGAGGSGWDQLNASQNIVVWESTDLVNWSDQRITYAGFDRAGCVWAPESIYNEETGEYYVYWSARDQAENATNDWALRVYLTKTRDFVTFTEPEVWASLNEQGDGQTGPNIIDSTIAYEDGIYYRFSTSDWHTVVDTSTSLDGPWTTVIGREEAAAHGLKARMEGHTVYQLPDGTWAVMGDDGGYYAHTAETLASLEFTQLTAGTEYSFDQRFRHGSVMRLSATEEAALLAAYGDDEDPVDPEPEDLIAEYTFDDGTLADSVGDGDLTAFGTAAVADDATQGKVLRLTGASGGYAQLPTGLLDGRDQLTLSFDMKSERTSGNFFSLAFGKSDQEYYFFRARGGDVRSAITQSSWQNESAVTGSVASGTWHHYDVVFDGSTMRVYADGALLGENTSLSTTVSDLGEDVIGYLGRSFYSADGYFQGSYDNLRIYGRALSHGELLGPDQLLDVTLADPSVLKVDPIVDEAAHTVVFPVVPGTDLSALAPVFGTVEGVTTDPASGTAVDLSSEVTYQLAGASDATWTMSAIEMRSPILPGYYADPNIFVWGDTYYIYVTTDGTPGWGGKDFYVWKSKDLVDWERSEEPFLTLDGANGNVPWATGNAWAPTIIERDGKFYFYFSGHNSTYNRKTIGVAVADSPEGPFVAQPQAMILNNESVTTGQAIDPAAFHDPVSGKYYLYWGNGTPAVMAELGDDMVSIKTETLQTMPGLTNYREGSFMVYREGIYHLTYSIDDTGSENYRVGYATSTSPTGPWTYRGVILQKDPSQGILGPGHNSILNVPGTDDWYIVYHRFGIPGGDGTHRETTIDKLEFDESTGLIKPVVPTLTAVDAQEIETGADVSALEAVLAAAEGVDREAFTGLTLARLDALVSAAQELLSAPAGEQAAVDAAVASVQAGIDALAAIPSLRDIATNPFKAEIEWLAATGVTTGWATSTPGVADFRPLSNVNRDQMAAFLYRLAGEPEFTAPEEPTFLDVPTDYVFYKEIEWLATTGVTEGWTVDEGAVFRPRIAVNRDVMAAFLYRYADSPDFDAPAVSPFVDVKTNHVFYKEIAWLNSTGISQGWTVDGDKQFRTTTPVKRDVMAAFLSRYADQFGN